MGNCCLSVCDLLLGSDDPRVLCHTCSIHPSRGGGGAGCGRIVASGAAQEGLSERYELGEELGRGQFGVIRLCRSRSTGARFACKSIAKVKLTSAGDVRDVQREIEIMQQLSDHPSIVGLEEVLEDEECVHMVMELCEGGELFDRVVERKMFCERDAARVCKTLVEVISFCQANGVIHRDLKPENILLLDSSSNSRIKVADFGLAVHFRPGQTHSGTAGSAYYIAPEVLRGEYGPEVDVWSAGVVLYVLLCGVPPFWDETEEGIFEAIRYGHLDLASDPWPTLSTSVKDLVRGMLCQDASKRLTPTQILNHEWILEHTSNNTLEDEHEEQQQITSGSLPRINLPRHSINADLGSWKSLQTTTSSSSSDSDTGFQESLLAVDSVIRGANKDGDGGGDQRRSSGLFEASAAKAAVPMSCRRAEAASHDRSQVLAQSVGAVSSGA